MTTTVSVNTYTHSVTYVADNILKSIKDIIRLSGLNPAKFVGSWEINALGLRTWLGTQDLETVMLEIYDPTTGDPIARWDIDIVYGWSSGEGSFWCDTEQLRYNIRKAGVAPENASYDFILRCRPGRPDVAGWSRCSARSTAGMVRQSLGSTVEHHGLGATSAYWRKI
ncbi:HORMA domain containing protein [Methylobacterium radiotolerans]|uniref:HORMA domain containing protein n=1 Tax=Methylobacterium radiotolerans TaxID=31998 RepID=UPI001F434B3E|nr:HORMA domain containing protein [Methylobacterium radiotolerans]UIY45251.1 HORMA domain containing protein [Methylobacterium radiotolerans]